MFQTDLAVHLNKNTSVILGGDFNCILEPGDSKNSNKNYSAGLKNIVNALELKEVLLQTKSNEFTFFRGDSAPRIDRFYAPASIIDKISRSKTVTVAFSDHRAVMFTVKVEKDELALRGRGYWKINSSLVDNDEVKERFTSEFEKLKNRHIYSTDRNA